ncbi:MAG: UDP-N-acetylmuramoyl-tripeptide--D-alanyl-D-alanine ligase [Pseudomonadota bacterium]|nr:UDP-N-acetylmuramoyl-tripeptide--D-alanyl-D-alanine ligase [Pseudomonadota bacterium]
MWNEKTAAEATGGKAQGRWRASRVEIDSRRIKPGDLFVALKGERFDGHAYVKDALAKGAVAAVVHATSPGWGGVATRSGAGGGCLIVSDTFKALEDLGRFARTRSRAKIVGVTGSVGKTGAKEMLRLALGAHGETFASGGNFNNHIGTPLSLANLPENAAFAVFEMGMNHAGEIAHLTKMVRPGIAAITNIEAVHMEFFASLDAIACAKAEIFEGMERDGIAVLNRDNAAYVPLAARARERGLAVVTFGEHAEADCRLLEYRAGRIKAGIHGKPLSYALAAMGRHWAATSLLTLAATHALGLDDEKTAGALAGFSEPEGRGRVLSLAGGITLVDDSYNASPPAMRAAFAKTAELWENSGRKGRKLAALGDMLELGKDAPSLHVGLAADIVQSGFDGVFTAGALMQHLHKALPQRLRAGHTAEAIQLLPLLSKELQAGDILLVKGSHGSGMHNLAKALGTTGEPTHAL